MTAKEAHGIIKKEYPGMVTIECLEFQSFYAFGLTEEGKEDEQIGGGYVTVDKTSGKTGTFNPTEDFDAFFEAKPIDVDTLN